MSIGSWIKRATLAAGTFGGSEVYNYLSKDGNILGKAQVTPNAPLDPANFQYGAGPNSDVANQIAAGQVESGLQQQAGQADREAGFYNQANGNFDIANAAQMRGADQIQSSNADKLAQLQALQGTTNAVSLANSTGDTLRRLGTQPMGPSYAEAQLHQGLDAGMAQQLAMARSGRSLGSGQAALNQAAFNNAGLAQQTNQAAATARIQEQQNYNQFQLGALGAAGQNFSTAGSLSGQAGGQATTIRSGNEGVQLQNAQLGQNQQNINNATTGAYNQLGSNQQQLGMQANQLGQQAQQFGQTQGTHAIDQQSQANIALGTGNSAIQRGNNAAEDQAAANKVAGDRQLITDVVKTGAGAMASDERVKTNIKPLGAIPDASSAPPQELPKHANFRSILDAYHDRFGDGPVSGNPYSDDPMAAAQRRRDRLQEVPGMLAGGYQLANQPAPPPPPTYAQTLTALRSQYAPQAHAPVDALNRVPGAGVGPSAGQSSLLAYMQAQQHPGVAPTQTPPMQAPMLAQQPSHSVMMPQAYPMVMPGPSPVQMGMVTSDVHSKTRIAQLEGQLAALGATDTRHQSEMQKFISGLGIRGTNYADDDPRSLRRPEPGSAAGHAYAKARAANPFGAPSPAVDLTAAHGYSYNYKEPNAPGAAPGTHVGPMAQDLENTAAAGAVHDTPNGKQVDTGRLSMVNTAAISELQRKQQQLEALQFPQYSPYDASLYPQTEAPDGLLSGYGR